MAISDLTWHEWIAGDPVMQIPYDRRTVDQLIVTFAKLNPAYNAMQQYLPPEEAHARLRGAADIIGLGPDDVPTRLQRHWLEQMLDVLAETAIASDEHGVAAMTPEERIEWQRHHQILQVEGRRRARGDAGS